MKDVRDNVFSFLDDWYGRLEDIIEDLKEHDFDVLNATAEWIDVSKDDKEYVLKLGGTPRTITINKIESLNESVDSEKELCDKIIKQYLDGDNMSKIAADLSISRMDVKVCVDEYMSNRKKNKNTKIDESSKPLTEGGIYPVALVGGADDAFLNIINEILGGDITEIHNLELIPALGFGGGGRYWYKADITLDEDTIVNFITEENTPETYRLMNAETLIINPYSDICITCSADNDSYHDGVTLDALSSSNVNMENLDKESNVIGSAIITKLFEAEDKIIEVLKQYEDEELDESLIPIQERWDDENEVNIRNASIDDKPYKTIDGYDIYRGIDEFDHDTYFVFISGSYNVDVDTAELVSDDIDEIYDWIEENPINESLIPIQEYWDEDEWDDDELASIYGGDTKDSQQAIADEMKELYLDEASHPKLGKKIKQLKGWKIYQGTDSSGDEVFRCFTPDDYRPEVGYEDWECETFEQAISWVQNYDLDESTKVNKEINNDDSKNILENDLSEENKDALIEKDTFGNYEENVFTALDNIEVLASSYEELNADTLKTLISRLEDELDTLKKINMKMITGIKQYTL